ncbi:mitochondrial cysteine synthase [Andalucia godoyi]|uniref:Mitochondrial cysteine synthase n=1 Tax=Andalucia godoyi TaxID=505711 RepID=A0A8K0AHZ4_ANDGO|nr:mitochondrial cysteine synthase [Andalucia godoyi]|eukprot:ANDGO_02832.mRNA.1 mitochondrial cysteine synthase
MGFRRRCLFIRCFQSDSNGSSRKSGDGGVLEKLIGNYSGTPAASNALQSAEKGAVEYLSNEQLKKKGLPIVPSKSTYYEGPSFDGLFSVRKQPYPSNVLSTHASSGPYAPAALESPLQRIGCTPLVELRNLRQELKVHHSKWFAKCELANPSGCHLDREIMEFFRLGLQDEIFPVADSGVQNIEIVTFDMPYLRESVKIVSRMVRHEASFPNVHVAVHVIPLATSSDSVFGQLNERHIADMRARGVEHVYGPGSAYVSSPVLVKSTPMHVSTRDGTFRILYDPFCNPYSLLAYFRNLGSEIFEQVSATGAQLDVFVDCVGTGALYSGVLRFLRSMRPTISGYVVEPACRPSVFSNDSRADMNMMLGWCGFGVSRDNLSQTYRGHQWTKGYLSCSVADAKRMQHLLLDCEGLHVDLGSSASLVSMLQLYKTTEMEKNFAVVLKCRPRYVPMSSDSL